MLDCGNKISRFNYIIKQSKYKEQSSTNYDEYFCERCTIGLFGEKMNKPTIPQGDDWLIPNRRQGRRRFEAQRRVPPSAEGGKGCAPLMAPPFEKGGRKLFRCC